MTYSLQNCRHGLFLTEDNDMISMVLRLYGEWAENSLALLRPLIPEGGCAVDVGANIGSLALGFARRVGPAGTVLAFEPQRRLFYNLCTNILLNNLFWVKAYQCLIGEAEGSVQAALSRLDSPAERAINRGGTSFLKTLQAGGATAPGPAGGREERLEVHALDTLLADLPACHLVKVDVEGAEPLVLKGMATTLRRHRSYLYLECGSEALHAKLQPLLEAAGYTAFWHACPHFSPNNYRQFPNFTGNKGDMNLLCVPTEKLESPECYAWSGLHPAKEWSQISALFPGFEF